MKHILKLAVCLSAMSPMPALAQTHYESKIEIGGHGGANLSMVSFTPGITQGLLPGANGGINFRYMEENHFGFIVELNFEQRGGKRISKSVRSLTAARLITSSFLFWPIYISGAEVGFS